MSRSLNRLFWFCVGVALSSLVVPAFASQTPVVIPGLSPTSAGPVYRPPPGVVFVTPAYNSVNTMRMPVTITQAGAVAADLKIPTAVTLNAARVAGAVATLARVSGPISLGLSLVPIICAETKICNDANTWVVPSKLQPGINYIVVNRNGVDSGDGSCRPEWSTCAPLNACNARGAGPCKLGPPVNPALLDPNFSKSATETDWQEAVAALTSAASNLQKLANMADGLLQKGQPLPVDPPVIQPSSVTTSPVSTVQRDQAGNPIQTITESVTYNSNPTNTYNSNYNPITNIISTINSTTTNTSTNTTTTTTTTNQSPPVESQEDKQTSIEFDNVEDPQLPTQELASMASPVSWGEGSCPPDPYATVFGRSIPIPVHVVCTYMSGVRMAVIAFFGLIAAYIVIGVKFEG